MTLLLHIAEHNFDMIVAIRSGLKFKKYTTIAHHTETTVGQFNELHFWNRNSADSGFTFECTFAEYNAMLEIFIVAIFEVETRPTVLRRTASYSAVRHILTLIAVFRISNTLQQDESVYFRGQFVGNGQTGRVLRKILLNYDNFVRPKSKTDPQKPTEVIIWMRISDINWKKDEIIFKMQTKRR
uniref:Uncharacterized protein n=1 Tax=Romanomermis culicivorax TaxID=13658 RepID=A0A915KZN0_ROMCU